MKLNLSSLKVHLAHCALSASARRIGITFSPTGLPGIAAVPRTH